MVIKKVGVIDLDGLYKVAQQWFYDEKNRFEEPLTRLRPGTAAGQEFEYRWTGYRKINEYVQQNVSVSIHAWDAVDMEVIKEGKKVKLTKCRIWIKINGDIDFDYQKRFKGKFGALLLKGMNRFVYQDERMLANWWDELYYRVYKLNTIIKEYLDMEAKGNAYYDIW